MAVNGEAKEVALKLGKNLSTIYKMMENPESCRYTKFLQLYYALPPAGQALLTEDFLSRHRANKHALTLAGLSWEDAIGDVVTESAKAITAAVNNKSRAELIQAVGDSVRSLRQLLDISQATENAEMGKTR